MDPIRQILITSPSNNAKSDAYAHKDETDLNEKPIDEATIDQIVQLHETEWELLQSMVWLDHDFIPQEILLEIVCGDKGKLSAAVGTLASLSFVSVIKKDGSTGMRFRSKAQEQVVSYMRKYQDRSKKQELLLDQLLQVLNKLLPYVTSNPDESWTKAKLYLTSIEAVFKHSNHINTTIALLNYKLGVIYTEIFADFKKALVHKKCALEIWQGLDRNKYPEVMTYIATSLRDVGMTYFNLGDTKRCLIYNKRALQIWQRVDQGNNFEAAVSLNNIGIAYEKLGDIKKALEYKEKGLTIMQALYPGNHPCVASILNNMGVTYERQGYIKKSLDYYLHALSLYQAIYQGNHPHVATSFSNVALAYEKLGDIDRSLDYNERALSMRQDLYQDNSFEVVDSLYKVGLSYNKLGDVIKGLYYYKLALEVGQTLFKGNHPDIATFFNDIGLAYDTLGDTVRSCYYHECSLNMREALYKGNHPAIADSLYNVALAYDGLGDVSKSLDYHKRAFTMVRALYKGNHPDVATSLNDIGLMYDKLGNIKKSLEYYERALSMRRAIYQDKQHHELADSLHNMGFAHDKLGHISKGIDYYERALKMSRELYQGNHQDIATSLSTIGIAYERLGYFDKAFIYHENCLTMRRALYQDDHPDVVEALNAVSAVNLKLGYIERRLCYKRRAPKMSQALNSHHGREEFKGDGTVGYVIDSRLEYYNNGLDQILELRLAGLGLKKTAKVMWLKSQRATKDLSFAAVELAQNVCNAFSSGNTEIVIAPFNLYNEHWVGLLFRTMNTLMEVVYMDSEQRAIALELKQVLVNSLTINGYKSRISVLELEQQSYNNCGLEVIENFVYYLTGTRATQQGAMYLHSLLVENSLLDPEVYGLKLEENNKLIRFLSNDKPIDIREITLFADQGSENKHERTVPDNSIEQLKTDLHRASVFFKTLDFVVDSARLVREPSILLLKKLALDYAQLQAMVSGVNSYSVVIAGAETLYQLHLGEYKNAFNVASTTISAMTLPVILAMANRPYIGLAYGAWMAAGTAYGAVTNAYSFVLEFGSSDATLRSAMAYKNLAEWLASSPAQALHDFESKAKEYKLQINDLLFEKEKSIIQAQMKGEFGQKVFDYIYLPYLLEKYVLLNNVIRGDLTEEEAQGLKSKPVAISYGALEYDTCVKTEDSREEDAEHYYCCNTVGQILYHVVLTNSFGLEILERL